MNKEKKTKSNSTIWIFAVLLTIIYYIWPTSCSSDLAFPEEAKNKTLNEIIVNDKTLFINDDNTFLLTIYVTYSNEYFRFKGKIGKYLSEKSSDNIHYWEVEYFDNPSYHPKFHVKRTDLLPEWSVYRNRISVDEKGYNTIYKKWNTTSLQFEYSNTIMD